MKCPCLLFDLDGTLTDADHLHFEAFNAILSLNGKANVDVAYYRAKIMGHANSVIFDRLFPGDTLARHEALALEKEKTFRTLATVLHPMPGLVDFLERAARAGVPCAVVTNAPRLNADHQLQALGLLAHFEAVVVGEELSHSKPHPLPYLTGLNQLDGNAARSFGFEDSLSGLWAGLAAGLMMAGVATGLAEATLIGEGATIGIRRYDDPRLLALVESRLGVALPPARSGR